MPNDDLGHIKGNAVRDFTAWYVREHGLKKIRDRFDTLPPKDRSYFRIDDPLLGISGSTWYPAATIHRALDALTHDMTADAIGVLADRGGQATVRAMMRGVQGIVFALFVKPQRWGFFVDKFWRLSYDSGRVEHHIVDPNSDESLVFDWRGHHALLCRLNTAVKVTVYESIGCRNTRVEHRYCVERGDRGCGSRIRWEND